MNELFLRILNMSISASWLIAAMFVLRLILTKAPKWVRVWLWAIVAVRLICPFSVESPLSLIPSAETIPLNIESDTTPVIDSGIDAINQIVNPVIHQTNTPVNGTTIHPLKITVGIIGNIWIAGLAVMLLYTIIMYGCLRHKINTAVRYKDNIFQSEYVGSPFVLGIIRPKIYVPFKIDEQTLDYVIAHEKAHIHRKDHWWKILGFLVLSLHWFNPFVWLAYILLCRDIELACDEKVIKELNLEQRANYTQALVSCSVNRRMIAVCPLAFGEVGVKKRVKSVLNYKRPTLWILVVAIVACSAAAICFLTNPIVLGDHLAAAQRDCHSTTNNISYDIQLGTKAMSGEIYVEQWIDGTCVKSAPVIMTKYADSISIIMNERRENNVYVGTDIQIETNQYGGSLVTYFPHPQELDIIGWAFSGYELDKKISVSPNKDVILAAKAFDTGSGIRVFDCGTLVLESERLQNASYMIVVRAVFSDDALGVTESVSTQNPL